MTSHPAESQSCRLAVDGWSPALQFALAAFIYLLLAFLLIPHSFELFSHNLIEFEGSDAHFRIAWFHDVIHGDEESIWFLRRAMYPEGMLLVYQSAGILKELIAGLLGGGVHPHVANNLIVLTTPVTVGLAGFAAARVLVRGGFAISLVTGWLMSWTAAHALLNLTGWLVSTEGMILFLLCLLLLRESSTPRRSLVLSLLAGLAAGLATWTFLQHIPFLALLGIIFIVDRLIARRPRDIAWLFLAAADAVILASPLLYQVWTAFRGQGDLLMGGPREIAYAESNAIATLLVPPREFALLGFIPETFERLTGRAIRTNAVGYIQYVVAALAIAGICSRRPGTGFLAAIWIAAIVLAFGPKITLLTSGTETRGIPWIQALLWDVPIFNTMRAPTRWNILGQVASGLLAGYGIVHLATRFPALRKPRIALASCVVILALHCAEVTFIVPRDSSHYNPEPEFLRTVRQEPGDFAILDIPFETGSHRPLKFGSIHRKGVVWGAGGRLPYEWGLRVERAFKFPGIMDMEPIETDEDIQRFASALVRHDVRYIHICGDIFRDVPDLLQIVIDQLEDEELWARQNLVEPPRLVWDDEHTLAYEITPLGAD